MGKKVKKIIQGSRLCCVHLISVIMKFKVKLVPLPDFFPKQCLDYSDADSEDKLN